MYENVYVAEYMMKANEMELQKKARNAWKWSEAPSTNKPFRLVWLSIRQRQESTVCCEPVPCC